MQKFIKSLGIMLASLVAVIGSSSVAFAQEGPGGGGVHGMTAMAIGLGLGLAALGGTLGQAKAAAAALEGISRNPNASDKVFVPMILGLAFIESLVLFTWAMMFIILNK